MVVRRLGAFAYLGYRAVIVHPLKLLFRSRRSRGKAAFLRNYASDGLVPLAVPEREQLVRFMRCVDCGLCDSVCPLVGKLDRKEFSGPSVIALAYSRATPDLGVVAATLAHVPADCGSCTLCTDTCPTRVPLAELFVFAGKKLEEVKSARNGLVLAPALPKV